MKKISSCITLLLLVFVSGTSSAQSFSIRPEQGEDFYIDRVNVFAVSVDGYADSEVVAATSIPLATRNSQGNYVLNLSGRQPNDQLTITVYVPRENGMYPVGEKTYTLKRFYSFETMLGSNPSPGYITAKEFNAYDSFTFANHGAGEGYQIVMYSCALVPREGNAEFFRVTSNRISETFKDRVSKMPAGTKLLFDEIILKNNSGEKWKSSPLILTLTETSERRFELYEFKNGESYAPEYIRKINHLSAFRFSGKMLLDKIPMDVLGFELVTVPVKGSAEYFKANGSLLSELVKEHILNLKPGDKVLINNARVTRPDGTETICEPVVFYIR